MVCALNALLFARCSTLFFPAASFIIEVPVIYNKAFLQRHEDDAYADTDCLGEAAVRTDIWARMMSRLKRSSGTLFHPHTLESSSS